jgi:DNA repair protein RadC
MAIAGRNGAEVLQRVLADGAASLSDGELLAVVCGAEATWCAAALAEAGGLGGLAAGVPARLDRRGWRYAAVVRAALELGRRATATPLVPGDPIRDARTVYGHFLGRLPQLAREVFYVLVLDGRNRLRAEVRVSEGTLTTALVHPREVFGPAVRLGAAAIVLVHNHPSGDPTPSSEDVVLTERLRQAGDLMGIRVLDHVVIAQGGYASLAEQEGW